MITPKQLVPLERKVNLLSEEVKEFEITCKEDMVKATTILSNLNKYGDSVREKKETLTKPINAALKNIRAMFSPLEDIYEEAIELLRSKMSAYQTAEVERVRKEEASIAARVAPGKGHLSVKTAIQKVGAIVSPDKEVATTAGLVQFREVKKFEVVDLSVIPLEYHLANEKMIGEAMKNNIDLPGVRYYTEQVPVNYR